ncbi:MAG: hypothetical protein FJ221_13205 [Lentisphaerae bacterium]|nr:hypothetical protein [Lentisphaerota bacterium]
MRPPYRTGRPRVIVHLEAHSAGAGGRLAADLPRFGGRHPGPGIRNRESGTRIDAVAVVRADLDFDPGRDPPAN